MTVSDAQGLIFSGYTAQPASCVLLLDFQDADPFGWLRRLLPSVTAAGRPITPWPSCVNLAITAGGLAAFGLDAATLLEFAPEFRHGMAARAAALGDTLENAPEHWEFGGPGDRIDAVLLLYADTDERLAQELAHHERACERFGLRVRALRTYLPSDGREHFGFRMGVSEPALTRRERRRGRDRAPLGEFLLGHPNAHGERAPYPEAPLVRSTRDLGLRLGERRFPFGRNGSYLVLRKLEQRVGAFRRHVGDRAAELVGRWPSGAPLVLYPHAPPAIARWEEQSFDYRGDEDGARCPFEAHVRRANPRDALGRGARAHRILRRGRLYGPKAPATLEVTEEPEPERGLVFLALNADLARQFETVQGAFLQGRGGFGAGTRDALLDPRFVRVRGGVYAFLPSISALSYLADLGSPRPRPADPRG